MRAIASLLSIVLIGAASAATSTVIPFPRASGEALIVPASSPVHFTGFNKQGYGHFRGRFLLTGTFVYGCDIECEPPLRADQLYVEIIPDRSVIGILPHFKLRGGDMQIFLQYGDRLANRILTQAERTALLDGKRSDVRRRVAIYVEDFEAGIECDGPFFSARFVALAEPPKYSNATGSVGGC